MSSEASLSQARGEIAELHEKVADMQRRIDKQAILLRALFVLLRDAEGVSEQSLLERFQQCETQRLKGSPVRCWNCGRCVNLRHNRCLYCNEPCHVQSAFELLDAGAWPNPPAPTKTNDERIAAGPPPENGITILD
jgi:hypothetical protein